jgi:hypothetical protein
VRYEILFHRTAPWLVGETTEERDLRRRTAFLTTEPTSGAKAPGTENREEGDTGRQYPDTYPGRVISVRDVRDVKSGKLPSLANMADRDRQCVELDLDAKARAALACRTQKVSSSVNSAGSVVNSLSPVTFNDRHGAVAARLRERHADAEQWERDDRAARDAAEAANESAQRAHDQATREWKALRETFAAEVIRANRTPGEAQPTLPETPEPPELVDVPESSFDREAASLAKALPSTVTHTGAGLYAVKATPAKSDDTQSGAPAGQTITLVTGGLGSASAYVGGYVTNATRAETRAIVSHTDGTVTLEGDLAAWLDTDDLDIYDAWSTIQGAVDQLFTDQGTTTFTASQYIRIFAGTYDENIVIPSGMALNNSAGFLFYLEGDPADDRANIVIAPSGGTDALDGRAGPSYAVLRHLTIDGSHSSYDVNTYNGGRFWTMKDCYCAGSVNIDQCALMEDSRLKYNGRDTNTARRTQFVGPAAYSFRYSPALVEGCEFSNITNPLGQYTQGGQCVVRNSTFHNCTYGLRRGYYNNACRDDIEIINCVFKDVDYIVHLTNDWWPEVTAERTGPKYLLRNNCFYGYIAFARTSAGLETKTYAEFTALNRVDAAGDLDATDPLLADAPGGDFSLTASSPCKLAGHGSGVTTDVNSVALDENHPDIGSQSSGALSISAPGISRVSASGKTVTLTVTGASDVIYRARLATGSGAEVDEQERSGPGDITLAADDYGMYSVTAWGLKIRHRSEPSAPVRIFAAEGVGPFEELRAEIVSRLGAHSRLAALLGTDESGAVPIYTSAPATARQIPCLVYTLTGVPEARLDRPGRLVVTLKLESWGGTPGVNDALVFAADEVLQLTPFEGTAWAVKRIARTGDVTRWEDDGRTEVRLSAWSITVDRIGT